MWLFFALLTPFFWSIVHVMDAHCVEDIFDKPWMGAITGSIASLIILVPLPIILPLIQWEMPSHKIVILAILAGCLIQVSQALYFQALAYSESGIVAAYWNMTPAMLPIASFFVANTVFETSKYLGISILILASVGMCLIDSQLQTRWRSFFLMLSASALQVIFFLVEDYIFNYIPFLMGYFLITIGLIIAGIIPLLIPKVNAVFRKNAPALSQAAKIFLSIEIINLCALFTTQKAVSLGIPSLVAAVESTIPAYTFLLSIVLLKFFPVVGDKRAYEHLVSKLHLVTLMIIGVYFVA